MNEEGTLIEGKLPEGKVLYIASNLERCMCSHCPVQVESVCAQRKIGNLKYELKNLGEGKASSP